MRRHTGSAVAAVALIAATGLTAASVPAYAAELVTAELVGTQNTIEVEQGRTADFTISMTATGHARCGSTHTAKASNAFSISATNAVSSGTTFSELVHFAAGSPNGNDNCPITGGGTVPATISAAATATPGRYTATLSPGAGTTVVTSTNGQGSKLEDGTATTLTFVVVAPANSAPVAGAAPAAANGVEGSTLSTAGSFSDVDGNLSAVEISSGAGQLVAARDTAGKLTGAWTWSLPTTDDVSGSAIVTARDAFGATATQTFTYAASNVAPSRVAAASSPSGNEGDTLHSGGRFADVSGDRIAVNKVDGAGDLVDRGDGSWTWSLSTTNETSGTVVVEAADGDGGATRDTFTFTAVNVAPGVRSAAENARGNEGTLLTTSGAFSDVAADSLQITHEGVGAVDGQPTGAWSWGYQAGDEGAGTVLVTASDGTATGSDGFTWTVDNVAPSIAAAANDARGFEGTRLIAGGRFSDPVDALTIARVSGPGTVTDNRDGSWSWSYDGLDDLSEQVVVEASDGDGGTARDTFSVTVENARPVLAAPATDATGSEGNTLATHGRFSDVPADTLTITKTNGPGTLVTQADGSWSWSLATSDQTSGSVTITAQDEDGGQITDSFDYSAIDVAPQLADAADDANGSEGETLTASGAFQDVAADRIRVVKVSGPGTVVDHGGGSWSFSLPTTDQLSAAVGVQAVDKDGVASVVDEFTVDAANVAPAAGPAPTDQAGSEGQTLSTGGSFTDVPADTITISKHSGAGAVVDHGDGTWSWSLATTDDGGGTVKVRADDEDRGTSYVEFTHTASNVAPVLSSLALTGATGTACQTGSLVGLSFTVSDPGSSDTMAGTITWGDGQTTPFDSRSVSTTHSYAAGNYTITVNVSDDDGAPAVQQIASVSRSYVVGAIQSPFNADGSSVFKYGSTVPVKVRITDCANAPVPGLAPAIKVALLTSSTPSTAINESTESTSAADTNGVLRYDSTSGNYIYNLATKSLSDGDAKYSVTVGIPSHTPVSQKFGLRTK